MGAIIASVKEQSLVINHDLLREKSSETDWDGLKDEDINEYAENVTNHLKNMAKQCIPNRFIKVNPTDPLWITSEIKRQIRKRKRLYRKAKTSNIPHLWQKFNKFRNGTFELIRKSKQSQINKLAENLKSEQHCSKHWWTTHKSFLNPGKTSSVPPLQVNDSVLTDNGDKTNILNDYFRNQTVINNDNVEVPVIADYNLVSHLHDIILTPDKIKMFLNHFH